jgi:hypothetical protein
MLLPEERALLLDGVERLTEGRELLPDALLPEERDLLPVEEPEDERLGVELRELPPDEARELPPLLPLLPRRWANASSGSARKAVRRIETRRKIRFCSIVSSSEGTRRISK